MVKNGNRKRAPLASMFLMLLILAIMLNRPSNYTDIKTSEVIDLFRNNKVESYTLYLGNGNVEIDTIGEEDPVIYKVPNVNYFIEI